MNRFPSLPVLSRFVAALSILAATAGHAQSPAYIAIPEHPWQIDNAKKSGWSVEAQPQLVRTCHKGDSATLVPDHEWWLGNMKSAGWTCNPAANNIHFGTKGGHTGVAHIAIPNHPWQTENAQKSGWTCEAQTQAVRTCHKGEDATLVPDQEWWLGNMKSAGWTCNPTANDLRFCTNPGTAAASCAGSTGAAASITWSGWLGRDDLAGQPAGSAESPVEQCGAGAAVRGFKVFSRLCSAANLRAALLLCDDANGQNQAVVDNGWGYRGGCSVCAEYNTECPSGWHAVGVTVHDGAEGRGVEPQPICQKACTGERKDASTCQTAPVNQRFECPAGQQIVAFQQRSADNSQRGGYEFRVGCQ